MTTVLDLSEWRRFLRHPLSEAWGDMSEVEFEGLVADMKQHGYEMKQQVWLFEGRVLDGWHRLRAAALTNKAPTFENFKGTYEEAETFTIRRNLMRRHLDTGQRGMVAGRLSALKHGGDRRSESFQKGKSTFENTAKSLAISVDTVKAGRKVAVNGTETLQQAVLDGDVSVSDAAAIVNEPASVQNEAVKAVRAGKARTARAAVSKPRKQKPKPEPSEVDIKLKEHAAITELMADEGSPGTPLVQRIRTIITEVRKLRRSPASKLPTQEEVVAYCKERGNKVDPEKWHDYYSANGWKVGKNPMKDWKAAVRTWEHNGSNHGANHGRVSRVEAPAGKYANVGQTLRLGKTPAPQ